MSQTSRKIKDSYDAVLFLETDTISSTYKVVEDGLGNQSGLSLKSDGVKAQSLEITTVATAATGNVKVLTLDAGAVKQTDLYPFGRSIKDIYEGFWRYEGSGSSAITSGSEAAIANDTATALTDHAPADITVSPQTTPPTTYFEGFQANDCYQITMEITVTPASGFTTGYVSFGLDTTGNGVMDRQIQDFALLKGASAPHNFTVHFNIDITDDINTNGLTINMKPTGADMTYSAVKMFILRTHKA